MQRTAIYVFWEKHGVVRDFVIYFLKGLKEAADNILVVVNGEITNEGMEKLHSIGCKVLQRPNEGYDFWAYKEGLEYLGEQIHMYDEIILCNCSCYGPIYPFSEMFLEMSSRGYDFWGITDWLHGVDDLNNHIQSFFIVFSNKVTMSESWRDWWRNLPETKGWIDTVLEIETELTKYFNNKSFTCGVYCDHNPAYKDMTLDASDILVKEQRCPIVKRKAFSMDYERFFAFARGGSSKRTFEYIKNNGLYDVDMMLDDLLATEHYYNIKNNLQLNYFLSSENGQAVTKDIKIAIFLHVFYDDILEKNLRYLTSMPENADIYVTTSVPEQIEMIKMICAKHRINLKQADLINSRGRADSAFMVHNRRRIMDYDLVCTAHDKKSSVVQPGSIGLEFGWHNMDSLLKSKEYVSNIVNLFISDPRIGIAGPVNVVHGVFQSLYLGEWGSNYSGVVDMLDKFEIDVPISPDIPPIAPMGAMFWFRPKALKKFLEYPWKYEDFPEEPMPLDGAIIHIAERSYSFFAQDAGYLSVWVASIEDAAVHMTSLAHCVRKLNSWVYSENYRKRANPFKEFLKKVLPNRIIIFLRNIKKKLAEPI